MQKFSSAEQFKDVQLKFDNNKTIEVYNVFDCSPMQTLEMAVTNNKEGLLVLWLYVQSDKS